MLLARESLGTMSRSASCAFTALHRRDTHCVCQRQHGTASCLCIDCMTDFHDAPACCKREQNCFHCMRRALSLGQRARLAPSRSPHRRLATSSMGQPIRLWWKPIGVTSWKVAQPMRRSRVQRKAAQPARGCAAPSSPGLTGHQWAALGLTNQRLLGEEGRAACLGKGAAVSALVSDSQGPLGCVTVASWAGTAGTALGGSCCG